MNGYAAAGALPTGGIFAVVRRGSRSGAVRFTACRGMLQPPPIGKNCFGICRIGSADGLYCWPRFRSAAENDVFLCFGMLHTAGNRQRRGEMDSFARRRGRSALQGFVSNAEEWVTL